MVSGGCIVSGSYVRRSLLFSNVNVRSYSQPAGFDHLSPGGHRPALCHQEGGRGQGTSSASLPGVDPGKTPAAITSRAAWCWSPGDAGPETHYAR